MLYNDKVTFIRSSSFIVENWQSGVSYTLLNPSKPAFLSIDVTVATHGVLVIDGISAGITISESITYIESGIQLSENAFDSILTLTPSWAAYNINIRAEDKQGQPIESPTSYGPFLASITDISSERQRDGVNISGWEHGQWLVGYIESFQPRVKDLVTTSKGWHGWAQDIVPAPHVNYPKGWKFFILAN